MVGWQSSLQAKHIFDTLACVFLEVDPVMKTKNKQVPSFSTYQLLTENS